MSCRAEETIKSTVINALGKSCNVFLRAGLPFRGLNRGDRDGVRGKASTDGLMPPLRAATTKMGMKSHCSRADGDGGCLLSTGKN